MADILKDKPSNSSKQSIGEDIDTETETPKDPPYAAEYAKSGRAMCKGCKESIAKVLFVY